MTIITAASVGSVAAGAGSASLAGLSTGLGISGLGKLVGQGLVSNAGGAVGASTSAGAIFGTVLSGTATGGLIGAASAAVSSGAVHVSHALAQGPLGWLILGAYQDESTISFDCWKPVLRDVSTKPSRGMLLKDLAVDPRIASITLEGADAKLVLQNIWDERFLIEFLVLPTSEITAHAERLH